MELGEKKETIKRLQGELNKEKEIVKKITEDSSVHKKKKNIELDVAIARLLKVRM